MGKIRDVMVPKTGREWFKFAWDIMMVCFFVFMIYWSVHAYAEGVAVGKSSINCAGYLYNFTNMSSSGTPIP